MIKIKKYGNRRLYDTERSRYVNLDEIAELIRQGETVQVSDVTTGEDLTRAVLLQCVLEMNQGAAVFPAALLHRVIRASGDHPGQRLLLQQLGQALNLVDAQLLAMEEQFPWMKAGAAAWGAGSGPSRPASARPEPSPEPPPEDPAQQAPPPEPKPDADAELAALRARLASLEARLKKG